MISEHILRAVAEISREQTLFYLFDLASIERKICLFKNSWKRIFPHFRFAYSYKTNAMPAITHLIQKHGGGAEVVSGAELEWALSDEFAGSQIYFDGPVKTSSELLRAYQEGVRIQIDSLDELKALADVVPENRHLLSCSFRLATLYKDEGFSRFGFSPEEIEKALIDAKNFNIPINGLHLHVGSNVNDPQVYVRGLEPYKSLLQEFYTAPSRRWLDIGGGYPCNSKRDQMPLCKIDCFAKEISAFLSRECHLNLDNIELITEPGRHLVEDDGFFYCQIEVIKTRKEQNIATLNAGGNFIRSVRNWFHPIVQLTPKASSKKIPYDLYGANCFEKDIFKLEFRSQGGLKVGDGIVIGSCGGYDIPSSNPWIRPLPPIYGLYEGGITILREAQSYSELRRLFGTV